MEVKKITFPKPNEHYNKSIFRVQKDAMDVQLGTVFLKKGTRIPETGVSKNPEHEFSIIQEGKIELLNEDDSVKGYLNAGEVIYVEALKPQAGNILEDTTLIYFLFNPKQPT